MAKTARVVAAKDIPQFRPLIARDLVKLYKAFTARFPNPYLRPDALTIDAFHALFRDCQTEHLHFIGRTSVTQPYVRFLVEEVLTLASVYLALPTLLATTTARTASPTGATLKPHVQPFGLLLVYFLFATQPLHAPPSHASDPLPASSSEGTRTEESAVHAARRRREEQGLADLTVFEFALREQEAHASAAATPTVASKQGGPPPLEKAASAARVRAARTATPIGARDGETESDAWEKYALDDTDLFPQLYPLPITVARPVMEYYLSGIAFSAATVTAPASSPDVVATANASIVSATLLPVERYVLAALHYHKAWNIVPVLDLATPLAAVTAAHAEMEAPLMSLPSRHVGSSGAGRGVAGGCTQGRTSVRALFGQGTRGQQSLAASLSQPSAVLGGELSPTGASSGAEVSLLCQPAFQARLQAYQALKAQMSSTQPQ